MERAQELEAVEAKRKKDKEQERQFDHGMPQEARLHQQELVDNQENSRKNKV